MPINGNDDTRMVDRFLDYLRLEKGYSLKTIDNYRDDLKGFERFYKNFDETLSWESIDSDIVRNWVEFMMDNKAAAASVNRRLSALRSLYRYSLKHGFVEKDPVYGIQVRKNQSPYHNLLRSLSWISSCKMRCGQIRIKIF